MLSDVWVKFFAVVALMSLWSHKFLCCPCSY